MALYKRKEPSFHLKLFLFKKNIFGVPGSKLLYLGILPKIYVWGHILMKLGHLIVIEGSLEEQGAKLSFEIIFIQKIFFWGGLGQNYHIWAFCPKNTFWAIS